MFQYPAQDVWLCPAFMSHLLPLVAFSSLMKPCINLAEAAPLLLNLNHYRAYTFFIPGEWMGIFTHFSHLWYADKTACQNALAYITVCLLSVNFQKSLDISCVGKVHYGQ